MSNGDSTANDISDKQRKKLLRFVENSRKARRSVKAHSRDKGQCWSLPFVALGRAGVNKPCRSCGEAALYVWGRRVDSSSLAPGDIIQIEGPAVFTNKASTRELHFPHDHHSMIVVKVESPGKDGGIVKVAHQWHRKPVHYSTIRLGSKTGAGVVHYYRPQSTNK